MTNRRGALVAIATAAFGGIHGIFSRKYRLVRQDVANSLTAFGAQLIDTREDSLSTALNRLGARIYSEEGIPMFLVCENVVSNQTSRQRAPTPPTSLNEKVASAFRRYADEWQRIRPDAPATDVARIVELLAYRDFASGGNEKNL